MYDVPVEQGGKLREGTIIQDVEHEESESDDSDDEFSKNENLTTDNSEEQDQKKGKRRKRSLLQARMSRKIDEDVYFFYQN